MSIQQLISGRRATVSSSLGRGLRHGMVLVFAGAVLAACATPPPESDTAAYEEFQKNNDPFEPMNRFFFDVNLALDRAILRPVAEGYRSSVPGFGQSSIRNFINNLEHPVIFANSVLQGDFDHASVTLQRLFLNTTIGVGGIGDPATGFGLKYRDEDFGQTLALAGVEEGPYIMAPLFGPVPPRRAIGLVVDRLLDPVAWALNHNEYYETSAALFVVDLVDFRSRYIETMDEIERSSVDFYAATRSYWRQIREDEIRNGKPAENPGGLSEDDFDF